ncbi:MAG: hypothetical protein L0I76_30500 [Pseudonocardia sp.]|nr:hypothetical protein [Pseudonocardia sp.]
MNLSELSDLLERSTDVLRVETLGSYSSDSDRDWLDAYLRGEPKPDVEAKRPWLDRLARAVDRGHPWRRLRVVPQPVTDYFRYQCEWSYVDNAAAGEDIRVMDAANWPEGARSGMWVGDIYVADDTVVAMHYDHDGRFVSAEETGDAERARIAGGVWTFGQSFTEWWAARPDLHRNVAV